MPTAMADSLPQLTLRTSDRGDGAVFDAFFAGYDRAFILPDEKEDEAGLRACLELNHGDARKTIEARYGPFVEWVALAEVNGAPVGGANLLATLVPDGCGGMQATANLNYVYLLPEARGRGLLRPLVAAVRGAVAARFREGGAPLLFLEQNDPFRMTAEDYVRDSEAAGIDQVDRLRIWARLGARIVDFPYVQPPLAPDRAPEDSLVYAVLGAPEDALSACVLGGHLRRFFAISVLKGAPIDTVAEVSRQLTALDADCQRGASVALLDPAPLLETLHGVPPQDGSGGFRDRLVALEHRRERR